MTTKTYENMTVTVSCNESEDTEMMELIKKMNDTKAARERTEEFYLPRIKAIGAAKWAEICNQLLGLCETAESLDAKGRISGFLKVTFHKDDTGEKCRMWISYNPFSKVYILEYSVEGCTPFTYTLNPSEEYYSPVLGEDKDSWFVKWDDYNIYNLFRSALMNEIERRIIFDESRIRSVRENYDEIAGK
ncbi:MAG: hypothetical protein DBY43_07960 [Clostridiaceae bacterium]|nr:MAG: hypothetical protein DBY43_07960 [Clostridiaceae bacterium]